MKQSAGDTAMNDGPPAEERAAPRFTLLIRSAKLIAPEGQFLCVIRDVSATGISLRGFHPLPDGDPLLLELQTGDRLAIERVWSRGLDSGYRFAAAVEVGNVIAETGEYPKRPLRLDLDLPLHLQWGGDRIEADLVNLSQQGARIVCEHFLALGQPLWLMSDRLPEIEAKVRWRDGERYGLAFDTTFNLREFALLAVRLQCPRLLSAPV